MDFQPKRLIAMARKAISDMKWDIFNDKLRMPKAVIVFLYSCLSVAFNRGGLLRDIGEMITVTVVSTVGVTVMIIVSAFGEILVRLGIMRVKAVDSK